MMELDESNLRSYLRRLNGADLVKVLDVTASVVGELAASAEIHALRARNALEQELSDIRAHRTTSS